MLYVYNIDMHDSERIGVGIVTCNRKEQFRQLLSSVLAVDYVDDIYVVKNKQFDYSDCCNCNDNRYHFSEVAEDVGVGYCKNIILKHFLDAKCDHIFLIEDDISIKDSIVFKKYIDTAKVFKLEHLIFGAVYTPPSWKEDPIVNTVRYKDVQLDFYKNLHGGFVYFTRRCILYVGLFDENYINAVEHIDHTYRICTMGFYTPFWMFADVHDSNKLLNDTLQVNPSTINDKSELQRRRTSDGFCRFAAKYGRQVLQIPQSDIKTVVLYLNLKINKTTAMPKVYIVNFNTTELTNQCIDSIFKYCGECQITVFDNSTLTQFVSRHSNVNVIDNTHGQIIDFNKVLELNVDADFYKKTCHMDLSHHGTLKHTYTVQYIIDHEDSSFLLFDSDTILKRRIDFIDDNAITVAGVCYQEPKFKNRFVPFILYFNVQMIKDNNIKYFDKDRILFGANPNTNLTYDTGASFYEDIVAKKLPYREIKAADYVVHLGGGSWIKDNILLRQHQTTGYEKVANDNKKR